jgi:hypothetical protein
LGVAVYGCLAAHVEQESADGTGSIQTVEGNSSDAVSRRTHDASGDYVRLG